MHDTHTHTSEAKRGHYSCLRYTPLVKNDGESVAVCEAIIGATILAHDQRIKLIRASAMQ